MKGQQKSSESDEGAVQIQEGAVATVEDPTTTAIASIQSAATFTDPNIKYVFRTENGGTQVMYRVIQVADGQLDGQSEGTTAVSGFPASAQSMTHAVIQGAFSNGDGTETESPTAETHYTYFPTGAMTEAGSTTAAVVTTQGSEALLGQAATATTGQFFVMMSPQEVLQGGTQRSIAPRTQPYSPSRAPILKTDCLPSLNWISLYKLISFSGFTHEIRRDPELLETMMLSAEGGLSLTGKKENHFAFSGLIC
ncbi:upstream stimulatory factor 1 isoform X2 [Latimeria chalumnae]|uniref:upstream stimulatory factor 1 isoform X2 n=1 Tax=Latimeria chalumnae TaxID=7897 RepID=UPI00313AF6B5